MIDNNEIERVLIEKCIELYLGVLSEREEIEAKKTDDRIDYGVPPKYMFLREYDAVKKTEHFTSVLLLKHGYMRMVSLNLSRKE